LEGREAFAQSVRAKRSLEACPQGMARQPKGLAWRNPAKPGFRHEVPEMRPNYMKNFCKCKTADLARAVRILRVMELIL
jgi:hypothetical protein